MNAKIIAALRNIEKGDTVISFDTNKQSHIEGVVVDVESLDLGPAIPTYKILVTRDSLTSDADQNTKESRVGRHVYPVRHPRDDYLSRITKIHPPAQHA